jgi:hypothetical protein
MSGELLLLRRAALTGGKQTAIGAVMTAVTQRKHLTGTNLSEQSFVRTIFRQNALSSVTFSTFPPNGAVTLLEQIGQALPLS